MELLWSNLIKFIISKRFYYYFLTTLLLFQPIEALSQTETTSPPLISSEITSNLENQRKTKLNENINDFGLSGGSTKFKQYNANKILEKFYPSELLLDEPSKGHVRMKEILHKYRVYRDVLSGKAKFPKVANTTLTIGAGIVGALAGGPLGAAAAVYVVDSTLGKFADDFESEMINVAKRTLLLDLDKVMNELGMDLIPNTSDAEELFSMAEQMSRLRIGGLGLSEEEQVIVEARLSQVSQDIQKAHLLITREQGQQISEIKDLVIEQGNQIKLLTKQVQNLDQRVTENTIKIGKLTNAFISYVNLTNARFKALDKTISEIQVELDVINNRITANEENILQNSQDIEFLQSFLFDELDPSQQIKALEAGFFRNMDPMDRKALEAQIELAAKKQEFIDNMSLVLNGANDLYEIMVKIGIDGPFMNELGLAVQASQHIGNAISSYLSGNYIGAIKNVTRLLGLGGPDIGAIRHEQIMNALGELAQGQQQIMEMLNALGEGQQRIMENQQRLFDALLALSDQVQQHHLTMITRLRDIEEHIVINRGVMVAVLLREVLNCRPAVILLTQNGTGYVNGKFLNYDLLKINYDQGNGSFIGNCLFGLQQIIINPGIEDTSFKLSTHEGLEDLDFIDPYIKLYYNKFRNFIISQSDTQNFSLKNSIASLLHPVSTTSALDEKWTYLKNQDSPLSKHMTTLLNRGDVLPEDLLKDPFSVDAVIQFIDWLLTFHNYFELFKELDSGGEIFTLLELNQVGDPRITGLFLLQNALTRVEISLAQQNLLNGDLLLGEMHRIFKEGNKESDDYKAVIELLKISRHLTNNFLVYSFRKGILETDHNFIHYQFALSSPGNDWLLKKITQSKWVFKWTKQTSKRIGILSPGSGKFNTKLSPSGFFKKPNITTGKKPKISIEKLPDNSKIIFGSWSVLFDDVEIPLPKVMDVMNGSLQVTPEVEALVNLRSRVIDEISSYNFTKNLPIKSHRDLLTRAIIYDLPTTGLSRDTISPTLTVPFDKVVPSTGNQTVVDIENATAIDDSGWVGITNNAPVDFSFPVGTTIITWAAIDLAGNLSSATQNITVSSPGPTNPPSVTSLVSPSGDIQDPNPPFIWNAVPSASWYYFSLNYSDGTEIQQWFTPLEANCSSGTGNCSLSPTTPITGNSGLWRIRTFNENGLGPWSESMSFNIISP